MDLMGGLFNGQRTGCRIESREFVSCSVFGVMCGVPKGSVLGLTLSYINSGTECTLSRFADCPKLWGAADTLGWDDIRRDLDRLEQQAQVNLMRFSKSKCTWGLAPVLRQPSQPIQTGG